MSAAPTQISPPSSRGGKGPLHGRQGLREAAQGFESLFTHMLFKSMRSTVHKSRFFHGGHGEETFQDLLDTRLAEASSKHGKGLGISEMIVKRYGKHVEAMESQKGRSVDLVVGAPAPARAPEVKRD